MEKNIFLVLGPNERGSAVAYKLVAVVTTGLAFHNGAPKMAAR
jgi:hypothetical protein